MKGWIAATVILFALYFPVAVYVKEHPRLPDPNVIRGPFTQYEDTHLYQWRDKLAEGTTDTAEEPRRSKLRLFEDGYELGPAHSSSSDIINIGKGRFVHWGESIQFSASDNSDPNSNGRVYRIER